MKEQIFLERNALIVHFNVSQWTAQKVDRGVTKEIHTNHNAGRNAGRYNKFLLDRQVLKPINKIVTDARAFHYGHTTLWGDNGDRILSQKIYFDYMGKMSEFQSKFLEAVDELVDKYQDEMIKSEARLGSMYNSSDYPDPGKIRGLFNFQVKVLPVPEANIKLNISVSEKTKLENEIREEIENRISKINKDLIGRVKKVLSHISSKMKEENPRIFESSFKNIWDLVDLIPKLDVTNNKDLDEIVKRMSEIKELPEEARNDVTVRKNIARQADDILKEIEFRF